MDDLTSKINEIMSDPEKLKEIQNLGKMMGLVGNSEDTPQGSGQSGNSGNASNFSNSAPFPRNGNQNNSGNNNMVSKSNPLSDFSGIDPNMLGKIAPIISSLNREDETTRLFDALAPFLSAERQEKLQKIRKMMGIIKLLPNIKNLGLF